MTPVDSPVDMTISASADLNFKVGSWCQRLAFDYTTSSSSSSRVSHTLLHQCWRNCLDRWLNVRPRHRYPTGTPMSGDHYYMLPFLQKLCSLLPYHIPWSGHLVKMSCHLCVHHLLVNIKCLALMPRIHPPPPAPLAQRPHTTVWSAVSPQHCWMATPTNSIRAAHRWVHVTSKWLLAMSCDPALQPMVNHQPTPAINMKYHHNDHISVSAGHLAHLRLKWTGLLEKNLFIINLLFDLNSTLFILVYMKILLGYWWLVSIVVL